MNAIVKKHYKNKPSLMIQAMIDGLEHYSNLPGVEVEMDNFGYEDNGICSGCAATWALGQTLGLTPKEAVDAIYLPRKEEFKPGIFGSDIYDFEIAFDGFRLGSPRDLLEMCLGDSWKEKIPKEMQDRPAWQLGTCDWEEQLPLIKQYQLKLIELGY